MRSELKVNPIHTRPDAPKFTNKAFMFESSLMLPLTDYATKRSGVLHGELLSDLSLALHCEILTLWDFRARARDVGWPTCPISGSPG